MVNLQIMTPQDAIDFFGSRKEVAKVCGGKRPLSQTAVHLWVKQGWIPYDKQCLLQLEAARIKGKKRYPVASRKDIPPVDGRQAA